MDGDVSVDIADVDVSNNASAERSDASVSNNAVSLEIGDGETSNDISVETVVPTTSKSQVQPAVEPQQDSSFITPSKVVDLVTPRHSERDREPKPFPGSDTSGSAFRDDSWNGPVCLDTPEPPKTTSTPKTSRAEFQNDTPVSPSLEAFCSNDSLDRYMPLHEVLQVFPCSGAENTPKKNEPITVRSTLEKVASLYESPQLVELSFPKNPSGELKCPGILPQCKITLRQNHSESEVDTLASPRLEAVCSNDSLDMYVPMNKFLQASPMKSLCELQTPSRPSGSEYKPLKNTPNEGRNLSEGPSSFKPHWPKYRPDDVEKPKAYTTFKQGIYLPESKDNTLAFPDLDSDGSNDSLEIPTTIRKGLKCFPKKTSKKKQSPSRANGSKCSKNWSRAGDSLNKGPFPKKSHHPKYPVNRVKSPKARASFKRRIYSSDSGGDTPASSDMDAGSSSSTDIFPIFRKVLKARPRKAPTKKQPLSRPSGSGSNSQNRGPPPHRSHRPKCIPSNVKSLKAGSIKRRRCHAKSEDDTATSPNVETLRPNDSLLVPPTILSSIKTLSTRRKDLSMNKPSKNKRPKTQSAQTGSESTPENSPTKKSDPEDQGPSPYKPRRPKYLPKNLKLAKRKRQQREDFLKDAEVFDAQLVKLPALVMGAFKYANPILVSDGDLMGTQTPIVVYFHPKRFFASFDELTFNTRFDTNIADSVRSMTLSPQLAGVEDYRNLTLFLTVTSDRSFFNITSRLVEDSLARSHYVLDFRDLKTISSNFGMAKSEEGTLESCELDDTYFDSVQEKSPKTWNLTFFCMVLERSFPSYKKCRLLRVLHFLGCCLFDPMMQQCLSYVSTLIRQVSENLILEKGAALDELVLVLDRCSISWICNRVIVQILSQSPVLRPAANALAYQSIRGILQAKSEPSTLSHVAALLADVNVARKKPVKDIYQLINICETLVAKAPSPFDSETKAFLEKLADFSENISLCYSYIENLYFMDTVTRLRTLSTVEGF